MNELKIIPLAAITESTFNPRKSFGADKLKELAESIIANGVLQPILVRPLTGDRVAYTDRAVQFEIIAGARRYRASEIAGLNTIPAIVRVMSTAQAMEAAILENLQRDDLTELEEAEGYEALMQHTSINADEVGKKIGKSRSYVYGRIKLLDLCQEARASLRDRTVDASRALLVARIPDHKLQIKAMQDIVDGDGYFTNREPMTYRAALEHLQQNYMLKLSDAKFDTTSITLIPAAGHCKECTKRTGHDPDLFHDVKGADICTDPPCFHKKEEAHSALLVEQAQAKGQTVITGKEAAELRGAGHQDKFTGYRRLDDAADSPTNQPLRKIIGGLMVSEGYKPTAIEHPTKKGVLVECLPNEVALKLLKMAEQLSQTEPSASKAVQELVDTKQAKAEEKAKAQYEQGWRNTLVKNTWASAQYTNNQVFTQEVHSYLLLRAIKGLSTDNADAICSMLDLGKVSPVAAILDHAKGTSAPALLHTLIIMQEACSAHDHGYNRAANEGLMLIARNVFGPSLADVVKEIKIGVHAKIWPKTPAKTPAKTPPKNPQKALTTNAPAAQAFGGGGSQGQVKGQGQKNAPPLRAPKPKMRAAEAMQGIAAALQGNEAQGDLALGNTQDIYLGAKAQGIEDGADSRPDGAASTAPAMPTPVVDASPSLLVSPTTAAPAAPTAPGVDDLYQQALRIITRQQKASVRLLKTELKIGAARAMVLMADLEAAGKVSAIGIAGAREVLVSA